MFWRWSSFLVKEDGQRQNVPWTRRTHRTD
jgi:hypothetical protein